MKHIVCFHLLNDYSGSPKVLSTVLRELLQKGYRIDLFTSRGGILTSLQPAEKLRIHYYNYRFPANPLIGLLRYLRIQLYTAILALRYVGRPNVVFYINTLLPAAPAIIGRLTGKQVVYHYHEHAPAKGRFYKTLCRIMQAVANDIICVSAYQRRFLRREERITVIPNALPLDCYRRLAFNKQSAIEKKDILMLSSLKSYKGIREFIHLAARLPQYPFRLIVNDTQEQIDQFLTDSNIRITPNLRIHDRQNDVILFYRQASLVINLSNKDLFVETFGLTALEAMAAGLPVIVPTVGGIAEIVDEGVTGYKIDVHQLDRIEVCIHDILSDPTLYHTLSTNARRKAAQYNATQLIPKIEHIINSSQS